MRNFLIFVSAAVFIFTACNSNNSGASAELQAVAGGREVMAEVSGQIAYINLDTLLSRYDMFIDMSGALEEKAAKAETEITSKGRSLERAVADAREKMEKGLVTRAQAAELETKLQTQEQNFYQHREKLQMELAEENQVMMNNLYHSLNKFLEEFNSDYRYGVIMSTSGGAPILNADPRLDITDLVVKGLNEKYAKEKK